MEKLQTLVWIVIGLVVFIWQMVKKAQEATAREQRERPARTRQAPPLPAASFEELLKQMQTQNQPTSRPTAPVSPAEDRTPAGRPVPREEAPAARSLEQTDMPAPTLERAPLTRSLEAPRREARRAATLPRAAVQHGHEDYWSRQQAQAAAPPARSIADMLRNPANVRTAFILSEVLQRRF